MATKKTASVESVPTNDSLTTRIRAIEQRWGKEFMEVMADVHDHVFGASPPATGSGEQTTAAQTDGGSDDGKESDDSEG